MSFYPEAKVHMALQQMDLRQSPPSNKTKKKKEIHAFTHPAFHQGVPVEPPNGLRPDSVSEGVLQLWVVPDGGHDLAHDGAGEAFLVGCEEVEGGP